MLVAVLVPSGCGLAIALVLHEGMRGANVFKSLFYLPICLSLAVIGQTWIFLYNPDWGLLNQFLRAIGLDRVTHAWLAEPGLALPGVMVPWCWQQIGLAMVVFLAGLTTIPTELTEAASMDGANYWQNLRHVVIPLLGPATVVIIALAIINSLKSFERGLHYDAWWPLSLERHAGNDDIRRVVFRILTWATAAPSQSCFSAWR